MMTNTRFSMLKASVLRKASLEFVQRQICLIVHLLSIRTTTSITQSGCVSVSMKLFNAIEKDIVGQKNLLRIRLSLVFLVRRIYLRET